MPEDDPIYDGVMIPDPFDDSTGKGSRMIAAAVIVRAHDDSWKHVAVRDDLIEATNKNFTAIINHSGTNPSQGRGFTLDLTGGGVDNASSLNFTNSSGWETDSGVLLFDENKNPAFNLSAYEEWAKNSFFEGKGSVSYS